MNAENLADRCRATVRLADDAVKWLSDEANAAAVGRERDSLVRFMKRSAIRASRLEKAALRPMCVGVFGPSQAGKSYLVEVLARPEGRQLRARFSGREPVDFLSQINPIGEKESTGLVTRFTTRRPETEAPPDCPVRLRLLTETDIVKVLGNTFFLDGDQTKETPPTAEQINDTLNTLRSRAKAPGSYDENDVIDLQAYFQKHFSGQRWLDALGRYWEEACALAPRLDLSGRERLFSFLWGQHEPFSKLYMELVGGLERLGCPSEVFAPIAALMPREGSILDVATLAGLGGPATQDQITVRGRDGTSVALARPILAALTAELQIEVADQARPFLDETDLLDFPGARSRQKVNLGTFLAENPDALKETFLRGKVAYLFDRYVAEQELTSMLLCVRPSNQEVVTLPDLVDDWINSTHGRTPEARAALPNLLFFVMTWFDSHFVDKAGDTGQEPGLRFRNRIEASLLGFFGKAHTWPRQWTPGNAFQNSYWFRNPNYPAESIIRYDGRREIEFLPEKTGRIQELRQGFMELTEAQAHFKDPGRAFDEALKLNDGGIGYLVENLQRVCRPELKISQVASRLDDLRYEIRGHLARFHISLDVNERLEERRTAAARLFDALEQVVADNSFGSLIRSLLIDPSALTDVVYGAMRGAAPAAASTPGTHRPGAVLRPDVQARPTLPTVDRERRLARVAIEAWVDQLRRTIESDDFSRKFSVRTEAMEVLVNELLELLRRANLEERISSDLRKIAAVERAEQSSAKVALVAATHLNRLVGDLGFHLVPPASARPEITTETGSRPAFATRPIAFSASEIADEPKPFGITYVTDWFHGFYRVAEENAMTTSGVRIDLVQNNRLKAILDGLESRLAA